MADDSKTGPFFEAFSNFGRNLRLPQVTVSDIMDHHSKNIAAMQEAAANATQAGQDVMGAQRAALEDALADIRGMVDTAREGGMNRDTARDLVAEQMEFTKRSFEATIATTTKTVESVRDVNAKNMELLKGRVKDSIEDVRSKMDRDED